MSNYSLDRMEHNKELLCMRKRIVRKQKLYFMMTVTLLILILSTITCTRLAFAGSTDDMPERIKVYKSIVIYGGDTLSSITSRYISSEWKDSAAYMHEVSRINNLKDDDMLIAGNYLIVPYYIEDPAGNL